MRESLLAVAVRPHSLALVRVTATPKMPIVTSALTAALPPDASPEMLAQAVTHLAGDQALAADRVILGIDTAEAVLRRLSFPFTGPGKIDLVLGPELEPYLTGPPAESALAWTMTALAGPPDAVTLAAAVPRQALVARVSALTAAGLPPDAACLDLAGLDALLAALVPDREAVACVLVANGRADFVCRLGGAGLAWRSLPIPDGHPPELAAFLAREAAFTLTAMAAQPPGGLTLILGGQAGDEPFAAALSQALGTAGQRLSSLDGWPVLADGSLLPESFACAYGLALLAARGAGTANFLRGELAPALSRSSLRRALIWSCGSALVFVVCAVAALITAYWRLDAAIAKTQEETGAVVQAAAPDLAPGLTLAQKLSALRGRLGERTAAQRDRGLTANGSALEILAAIHQGLGPGGATQAKRVAIDETRATIDAVADDYTTVDAVKRRLAALPLFTSVDIRGAKNNPDKKQVEFQLDLKLAGSREGTP
jgi:general secretion pathway protein L